MAVDAAKKEEPTMNLSLFTDKNSRLRRNLHPSTFGRWAWFLFRLVLLVGISFIILYPFLIKLSSAFMAVEDTYDDTVSLIPRHPTLDNIKYLFENLPMLTAMLNTLVVSLLVSVLSAISSTLVGYGLAKYRFRGKNVVLFFVLFSLLIPFSTIIIPSYMYFRYFDFWGIFNLIFGQTPSTINTFFPMGFLAFTGLGFRSGLYILIMMQCFKGLPKELDEAGMVDGAGTARTFWSINLPLAKSMIFVVFVLAFAWQWTDTLYSSLLFSDVPLFPQILSMINARAETALGNGTYVKSLLTNGAVLLMILPLIVVYIFVQRKLVQGIERTGLVG